MFSCLQILEAFLWFVLITLLNVTLIILTLSVSRLLNLLLRLVAFLLFLNPQCLASISRWITASSSWKRFCLFVCRALSSIMVICMLTAIRLLLTFVRSEERFSRNAETDLVCRLHRDLHSFPTRRSSDLSRLLNLLLRLVAFLLFLNPQCLASISRWITASSSWKRFCLFVCRALSSIMVICMLTAIRLLLTFVMSLYLLLRS